MNDITQSDNPFAGAVTVPQKHAVEAMVSVEQSRAIAETQGAMVIAKRFPRDPVAAMDRILNACTRPTLAEQALYTYARGGTDISGPSIRLAEAIAQAWHNLQFGIRELEQRPGESTMEAFAWDVEANVRQVKVFQVKHERHTKKGSYALTDPRDIYEATSNQGARRLRACILGVIPGDVIEAAVNQCEMTLKTKAEVTPEVIKAMLEKFAEYAVTKEQIEKRIQRHMDAMQPAQLVSLRKIYVSLKDGMSKPGEWFEIEEGAAGEAPKTGNEGVKDKLKAAVSKPQPGVVGNPAAEKKVAEVSTASGAPEPFTDEAAALLAMERAADDGEGSAILDRCKGQPFRPRIVGEYNKRFPTTLPE